MARIEKQLPKELHAMARVAIENGWTIERRGSHFAWKSPDGELVVSNGTPAGGRATANHRARLRRAGLPV